MRSVACIPSLAVVADVRPQKLALELLPSLCVAEVGGPALRSPGTGSSLEWIRVAHAAHVSVSASSRALVCAKVERRAANVGDLVLEEAEEAHQVDRHEDGVGV